MFLIVFLLITGLMHYVCVAWTCTNTPHLSFALKQKIISVILTFVLAVFFILPHHMVGLLSHLMLIIGDMWFGILYIYFMFVMAALAVQFVFKLFKHPLKIKLGYWIIGISALVVFAGIFTALKTPSVTELEIITNISGTHNTKILFITDTHFGGTVTASRAKKLTKQVNALAPDFILFGGDIFEDTEDYIAEYVQAVKQMKAKKGKFGVPGNHEYYEGVVKTMDLFRKADITPLQNTGKDLGSITLIGVNDIVSSNISEEYLSKTVKNYSRTNDFNILISHTPLYFEAAAKNGINLMLSGHTHNGQIWPFKYFVRLRFKYINGLYRNDNSNLYVSSGTFYWGPALRLFTKNELVLITLKEENYEEETPEEDYQEYEEEESLQKPAKRVPVSYDDIVGTTPKKKEEPKPEPKEEKTEPVDLPVPQSPSIAPAEEGEDLNEEDVSYDIQIIFEDPKKEKKPDTKIDKWPEMESFIPWSDVFHEPQHSETEKAKTEENEPVKSKEEKPAVKETQPKQESPVKEETEEFSDILIFDSSEPDVKEAGQKTDLLEDTKKASSGDSEKIKQDTTPQQIGAQNADNSDAAESKDKKNKKDKKKKSKQEVKQNTAEQQSATLQQQPEKEQKPASSAETGENEEEFSDIMIL